MKIRVKKATYNYRKFWLYLNSIILKFVIENRDYSFPTLGSLARLSAMASSLGMTSFITPSLNCW